MPGVSLIICYPGRPHNREGQKLVIGDRVQVETRDFTGAGNIMDIAPGEIWPIQVMLDEPYDENGQRVYRFARYEVKVGSEEPQRFHARVASFKIGYNIGDEFIISRSGPNGYYDVYLKNRPDKGPVGSYITDFFEVIGPYTETKTGHAIKPPVSARTEVKEQPAPIVLPEVETPISEPKTEVKKNKKKKLSFSERLEEMGQINIFDLI